MEIEDEANTVLNSNTNLDLTTALANRDAAVARKNAVVDADNALTGINNLIILATAAQNAEETLTYADSAQNAATNAATDATVQAELDTAFSNVGPSASDEAETEAAFIYAKEELKTEYAIQVSTILPDPDNVLNNNNTIVQTALTVGGAVTAYDLIYQVTILLLREQQESAAQAKVDFLSLTLPGSAEETDAQSERSPHKPL